MDEQIVSERDKLGISPRYASDFFACRWSHLIIYHREIQPFARRRSGIPRSFKSSPLRDSSNLCTYSYPLTDRMGNSFRTNWTFLDFVAGLHSDCLSSRYHCWFATV